MAKKDKEPGRLRQLWRAYKMTAKADPSSVWIALGVGLVAGVAVFGIGWFSAQGNPWLIALWAISSTLTAVLLAMVIMSRRAEQAAYAQIEGQSGAVGAVIQSSLRGSWTGAAQPVQVNARTRDAVYRVIGKTGVNLIGEGDSSKLKKLFDDETRKIHRAVPNVHIKRIVVGTNQDQIRLHKMMKTVKSGKKQLSRGEIRIVAKRLEALGNSMPIPKGIDPMNFRPSRKM
jgi:hypothetical protein